MQHEGYEERKKYVLKQLGQILMIGFAYFVFSGITGLYIPCPIRLITGFKCPGCGVTHYALAMIHGDIQAALEANHLVFFLAPLLLLYGLVKSYLYVKTGKTGISPLEAAILLPVLIITISFGIYRNL